MFGLRLKAFEFLGTVQSISKRFKTTQTEAGTKITTLMVLQMLSLQNLPVNPNESIVFRGHLAPTLDHFVKTTARH